MAQTVIWVTLGQDARWYVRKQGAEQAYPFAMRGDAEHFAELLAEQSRPSVVRVQLAGGTLDREFVNDE